jgi:hypothetical protein
MYSFDAEYVRKIHVLSMAIVAFPAGRSAFCFCIRDFGEKQGFLSGTGMQQVRPAAVAAGVRIEPV